MTLESDFVLLSDFEDPNSGLSEIYGKSITFLVDSFFSMRLWG